MSTTLRADDRGILAALFDLPRCACFTCLCGDVPPVLRFPAAAVTNKLGREAAVVRPLEPSRLPTSMEAIRYYDAILAAAIALAVVS